VTRRERFSSPHASQNIVITSQPAAATTTTTFTALRLQTSLRFTRCKLALGERKSYIIHVIVIID
jgi:hypothetical protein